MNVGKNGNSEIGFVAYKQNMPFYVRVAADMTDERNFVREIRPMQSIEDNYEGIRLVNVLDWLLRGPEKKTDV